MFWSTSCEITLRWMPQNTLDKKITLVLVMAGCRQATSHYQSQCWQRSMPPSITSANVDPVLCGHITSLGHSKIWITGWFCSVLLFPRYEVVCQATSHYLSQCWHRSLLPYFVTKLRVIGYWMILLCFAIPEIWSGVSGNKPLPEPMLTQISAAIFRH